MVLNGGFNPFEPDWTTRESSPNRGDKNNNMKSSRRCNLLALKMCFDNMIPTTRPKTPRYRYQPLTTLDRADCEEKGRNSWQFSEMPEEIFRWRNKREPSKHISENSLTSKKKSTTTLCNKQLGPYDSQIFRFHVGLTTAWWEAMPRYSLEVTEVLCVQHKEQKNTNSVWYPIQRNLDSTFDRCKRISTKNKHLDEHPGKERWL